MISRDKIQRRWVEISFTHLPTRRIRSLWSSSCFPRRKRSRSSLSQLAVFGLYMGASFAPNHIGMPLVSPS